MVTLVLKKTKRKVDEAVQNKSIVKEGNSAYIMKIFDSILGALVGVLLSVVMLALIAILI